MYRMKVENKWLLLVVVMFMLNLGSVSVFATTDIESNLDRTEEEIIERYVESRSYHSSSYESYYEIEPSVDGTYTIGKLKDQVLFDGLNEVNFVRYLAGLPDDVVLDYSIQDKQQTGALVNRANNVLDHYPQQPQGMSDDMYSLGRSACSTSNLAMGYSSLRSSVRGYMDDSDSYNISVVGHRRWLLNPDMGKTMFGFVDNYSSLYAIDQSGDSTFTYDYVGWPSRGNFPSEYMPYGIAWSVSPNIEKYDNKKTSDIVVTMTDVAENISYTMTYGDENDGYFNVDTNYYGEAFCIIFKPDENMDYEGKTFHVLITGLYDKSGNKTSIEYNTSFFSLYDDLFFQSQVKLKVGETIDLSYLKEKTFCYSESKSDEIIDVDDSLIITGKKAGSSDLELDYDLGGYKRVRIYVENSNESLSSWAAEGYEKAKGLGLISYSFDNSYDEAINRLSFTEFAVDFCENLMNNYLYSMETAPFTDVSRNYDINIAYEEGLIVGTSATTFSPNTYITREQAAKLMMNIVGRLDQDYERFISSEGNSNYDLLISNLYADDDSISAWAKDAVYEATELGLIKGVGNDYFDPKGQLTYEQTYLMFLRIYELYRN